MSKFLAASIFSIFWLISCTAPQNETADSSNSVSENKSIESTGTKSETGMKSNKLDACQVLPKAEAERILGQSVKSAELSRVMAGTDATAAFSQCTYQTASGQTVEFFARRSPVSDNTPEAIQKLRDTMKGFGKTEEMSNIGDTAFWISGINQLHVFDGESVYLYVTARNFKDAAEAKAKSVELARQATNALSPE